MSNSFYGGRDGRPMIIKNNYKTVKEMLDDFAGAAGTTDKGVNFGDYVIIISENKNNPENGRLFRRGKDFNNLSQEKREYWELNEDTNIYEKNDYPAYGAMYIGQIVGPSGNAPHLHLLSTKADVNIQYADFDNKPGYDVKVSEEDSEASLPLGNLIPGKDGENFNDKITWRYCSVRDENQQETDAYIGFEIPYTVIEWEAQSENPYYNRSNDTANFINTDLITRHEEDKNAEHPFYQKWQIHIPKGIHGQSIENLRVEGLDTDQAVLKYDLRNFDKDGNGISTTYEIGAYNLIKNIVLSDTGYLDIDTTASLNEIHKQLQWVKEIKFNSNGTITIVDINGDERTGPLDGSNPNAYKNLIQWITNVTLDPETGAFKLEYNNGTAALEESLQWVKDITFSQDGTVTIDYTNKNNDVRSKQLQWVTGTSLSPDGTFTTSYNNGNSTFQEPKLKWPTNIQLDSSTGKVTTTYNDGSSNSSQNPQMDWIKSATLDEEKNLSIDYVNATDINVSLKTPNTVNLKNGQFIATYNTGDEIVLGMTEIGTSACAGAEEDPNLNAGGVWFVVQE